MHVIPLRYCSLLSLLHLQRLHCHRPFLYKQGSTLCIKPRFFFLYYFLVLHRFVSWVGNKDTITLYWYDKNHRHMNAYEWETGNLLSGKLKGFGTAGRMMGDFRVLIDNYLFHLSGKLFCLVWNEELSSIVHCSKFVVDESCYSHDNCNGSLCAWFLSSQYYYLGPNTTLYDAAIMNKKSLFDSAGKV
ncbi:uncharacterized protein LOC114280173 [Camellia sinensis]|uniref:uncharacterized protein LOC114280173 n=1 Tax=Camellia sinensis TaxID=4442 RepID=UPI0010356412|nr:uncharacterized protein LOC114280173 [Camellia sinensis]